MTDEREEMRALYLDLNTVSKGLEDRMEVLNRLRALLEGQDLTAGIADMATVLGELDRPEADEVAETVRERAELLRESLEAIKSILETASPAEQIAYIAGMQERIRDLGLGGFGERPRLTPQVQEDCEEGGDKRPELPGVGRDEEAVSEREKLSKVSILGEDRSRGGDRVRCAPGLLQGFDNVLDALRRPRRDDVQGVLHDLVEAVRHRAHSSALGAGARLVADHHAAAAATESEVGAENGAAVIADSGGRNCGHEPTLRACGGNAK